VIGPDVISATLSPTHRATALTHGPR